MRISGFLPFNITVFAYLSLSLSRHRRPLLKNHIFLNQGKLKNSPPQSFADHPPKLTVTMRLSLVGFLLVNFIAVCQCRYASNEIESSVDKSVICVTKYLVKMEKLDKDFVRKFSARLNTTLCDQVITSTLDEIALLLAKKIDRCRMAKSECLLRKMKSRGAFDYFFILEVLRMQTMQTEKSRKFEDTTIRKLKVILTDIAEDCESDENYNGIFEDYLECENQPLSLLQETHCLTKFALDKKIIQLERSDRLPARVSSSKQRCRSVISKFRTRSEKNFFKNLRRQELADGQVRCAMERYCNELGFKIQLAKEVARNLNLTRVSKRRNAEKIHEKEKSMLNFVTECL